jgi:hypothetical protein
VTLGSVFEGISFHDPTKKMQIQVVTVAAVDELSTRVFLLLCFSLVSLGKKDSALQTNHHLAVTEVGRRIRVSPYRGSVNAGGIRNPARFSGRFCSTVIPSVRHSRVTLCSFGFRHLLCCCCASSTNLALSPRRIHRGRVSEFARGNVATSKYAQLAHAHNVNLSWCISVTNFPDVDACTASLLQVFHSKSNGGMIPPQLSCS